jgi:hypothetical protein
MSNWYREYKILIENSLVPFTGKDAPLEGELGMGHKDNLTVREAKKMLDDYPNGFLCHGMFERDAFVAVNKYGIYVFYEPRSDRLLHWDWINDVRELSDDTSYDIMSDWAYLPSDEMSMTNGGMEWWDRIRSGLEVPQEDPQQLKEETYDRTFKRGSSNILAKAPSEKARYDYYEMEYELLDKMVEQYRSGQHLRQPWTTVSAARVTRIWNTFAATGMVRDEKGLDTIAHQLLTNIVLLWLNTALAGHTPVPVEDVLSHHLDEIEDIDEFVSWAVDEEHGGWKISDYGFPRLGTLAALLFDCQTAEEKLVVCDAILNVTHPRSDMASWFIEGGSTTLNALAND